MADTGARRSIGLVDTLLLLGVVTHDFATRIIMPSQVRTSRNWGRRFLRNLFGGGQQDTITREGRVGGLVLLDGGIMHRRINPQRAGRWTSELEGITVNRGGKVVRFLGTLS